MNIDPSKENIIVLSLGGSLIVPDSGIDIPLLKKLRQFIVSQTKKGRRFIIVVGGGSTARQYQRAAAKIMKLTDVDIDWIGIHATRLNGQLLRDIFRDIAQHTVVKNPTRKISWHRPVLIAAGWKPGWSTDYVAVQLAKKYKSKLVINLSNIDWVYDKDPKKYKSAKKCKEMTWKQFRKLVGHTWSPGVNAPFDPIASRVAEASGMTVVVMGKQLQNMAKLLKGESFKGTVIDGIECP